MGKDYSAGLIPYQDEYVEANTFLKIKSKYTFKFFIFVQSNLLSC